ncbi:MAG: serine hydrolase domain-containing protein [Pseudomonadota bacterium]
MNQQKLISPAWVLLGFFLVLPAAADDLPAAALAAFQTGLVERADRDDADAARFSVEQRQVHHGVPGAGVAVISEGKVSWAGGFGNRVKDTDSPVDADTVFSVGSVSKMVNAGLILRLVAEGLVDLDTDVNTYLKSWQVEDSRYTRDQKVTLRMILSHTAGFSQHGFGDFEPGADLPTALETLNGKKPARHGRVRLMFKPGTEMDYSGGGTTVSQVLVEDVTGLSYPEAARRYVFEPLGMSRSTFVNPLPADHGNIAHAHDRRGRPTALPRGWEAMPEMAASGLWTSARDLGAFVVALLNSANRDDGFLPRALVQDMMTRVPQSWHGLGPRLNGEGETRVFHHGGSNNSYRAWIEGHLGAGSGMVILTNGTNGNALYSEIRYAAEESLDWPVKAATGFTAPSF